MDVNNLNELFLFMKSMHEEIETLANKKTELAQVVDKYESDDIKELAIALSKAQGEYPRIHCNRENPYFKSQYADLDSIMVVVRPVLSKNGLSITQQTIISPEGATILHTRLRHGAQWVESRTRIVPPKNDMQSYSSTLTYMKRNSALTLLGITVSNDKADDDAEVAMADAREIIAKGPSQANKYDPRKESTESVTKEQLEELEYELSQYPDIAEEVMDKMKIQSLADLPKSRYAISIQRIREIKRLRNEGPQK